MNYDDASTWTYFIKFLLGFTKYFFIRTSIVHQENVNKPMQD